LFSPEQLTSNPYPEKIMTGKHYHLNKFQIINHTQAVFDDVVKLCRFMSDKDFFAKEHNKWSVAENLEHLSLSLKKSWQALFLPKIILRWKFSKPSRESYSYEELMDMYYQKLTEGAKASKPYIPVIQKTETTKDELITRFEHIANKYLNRLKYYWEDEHIDNYQIPHPVLGSITTRELLYFNMFHSTHHYKAMKELLNERVEYSEAD
jgi:hypothetical protein